MIENLNLKFLLKDNHIVLQQKHHSEHNFDSFRFLYNMISEYKWIILTITTSGGFTPLMLYYGFSLFCTLRKQAETIITKTGPIVGRLFVVLFLKEPGYKFIDLIPQQAESNSVSRGSRIFSTLTFLVRGKFAFADFFAELGIGDLNVEFVVSFGCNEVQLDLFDVDNL